jgi:hypothetical protein
MRTFEHFNTYGPDVCPICGTNDDKEIMLIPIKGTKSGNNIQAIQTHTDCLQQGLLYDRELEVIYAVTNK